MDLLDSKNFKIVLTSWLCNCSLIEFKFSALFFQNSNSAKGPTSPYFNTCSGSNFNTFLIYFVQVIIDPSNTWALSLLGVLSLLSEVS